MARSRVCGESACSREGESMVSVDLHKDCQSAKLRGNPRVGDYREDLRV